jgi:hypothetical protein
MDFGISVLELDISVQIRTCGEGEALKDNGICSICEGPDFYLLDPVAQVT